REVAAADPDLEARLAAHRAALVGVDAVGQQHRQHLVGLRLVQVGMHGDLAASGQHQRRQHGQAGPPAAGGRGWNAHFPAPVVTGQDCWRHSCCTPSDVRLATFEVSCDWNRNLCETMVISNSWLGISSPLVLLISLASRCISVAFALRLSNAETIICVACEGSAWAAPETASVPDACAGSLTPAARSWAWPKSRTSIADACGWAAGAAPPVAPVVASIPATWMASIMVFLLGAAPGQVTGACRGSRAPGRSRSATWRRCWT